MDRVEQVRSVTQPFLEVTSTSFHREGSDDYTNDRQNIVMLECADGRQVQPVWRDVWTEVAPGVQTSCSQNTQRVRLTRAACPMRIQFEHISEYVSYSDREFCRQSRSRYWVNYVALPAEV